MRTCGECKNLRDPSNRYGGSCDAIFPLWAGWALEEMGTGLMLLSVDQDASSCLCFEAKEEK